MAANEYHFVTRWHIPYSVRDVVEVLSDAAGLPRWWPAVYLEVSELQPGDETGLGRQIALYTKGWLPYTLRWQFEVVEVTDRGFALRAWGDFDGRGEWMFTPVADGVIVQYDWRIIANKPLLRRLSFLMKPLFSMNHHWAMDRGHESLLIELGRRAAERDGTENRLPAPPPPTPSDPIRWVLALSGIAV